MLCVAPASGFAQLVDNVAERELPDWSGVWQMLGPTVFDAATVEPSDGRAGNPGVREFPPYNEEWESLCLSHFALVQDGRFPDPITRCGIPVGFPAS